ncbi:MAG: GNAT family N-acetyltransferase [Bacteroidetes bacterium]|nr:GNAT family N-acetyltransferase [Bacteroidota bacterium]
MLPKTLVQMVDDRKEIRIRAARQEDLAPVERLLVATGLAPDGIDDHLPTILIAEHEHQIVATAALEIYNDSALLRSVAVDPDVRGTGVGKRITMEAINLAQRLEIDRLFLLTDTAGEFFPKFGFRVVSRLVIPDLVKSSIEFTSMCADTALAMELRL